MKNFKTVDETIGYVTAESVTNTDERHLVAGSRNVLIDRQRKVKTRNGNTLLVAKQAGTTRTRNGATWNTSTGTELAVRAYDDEWEVYLSTLDGETLNAYYRIANGFPTTGKPRWTLWYDDTEALDVMLGVWGNDSVYEWGGGAFVVDSVTTTTITKKGTSTFAENRLYTTRNKTLLNPRTGNEHTYSAGEDGTILTVNNTTGIQEGDVLLQKVITTADVVADGRNNHTIYTFENHVCYGSDDDEEVYVSKNNSYTTFTTSSPRVAGDGITFTLDDPTKGFGTLNDLLIIFAGRSSIYQAKPESITVGSTLAETFGVKKFYVGVGQSAQNQEVIQQIGESIIYLSHEPAVRQIFAPDSLQGGQEPRTLSNPIKPDMDAETWTDAAAIWYKNAYYLSAPSTGRTYILEFVEDADGKLRRFWQPPQTMFISSFFTLDDLLYGNSYVSPNAYRLFNPEAYSDEFDIGDKLPILCVAKFAYRNFKDRFNFKNFDEFAVEGEISPSTNILLTLNYDFGGSTTQIEKTIEGDDTGLLAETLEATALAQQPLGQQPLGGSTDTPDNTAKFRVIFELPRTDFVEIQDTYESNDVDKFWSIISHGPNVKASRRQNITIKR